MRQSYFLESFQCLICIKRMPDHPQYRSFSLHADDFRRAAGVEFPAFGQFGVQPRVGQRAVRLGERAQALRQYRLCRDVLDIEFAAVPEPATEELYETVRLRPEQA